MPSKDDVKTIHWWRARTCAALFDVSRSTWERWVKEDPAAPKPVAKDERYVAWRDVDVLAYQTLLEQAGRGGHIKKKECAA